ncbi:hypothetical protein Bca52824_002686 [Brassica carinata]|uniref:RNase H type-1 domain-containing protein n=1 Tax=Brassica carinata TaxID=52824 RepID=A0A8X7WL61_BRACI|nr:hypothetical protein Bca52824_002686 [Brassica carinata]
MSVSYGYRGRGEISKESRRRQKKDDDIIPIPEFDYSDLIEKYKLTLVGRMFHIDGRSVDALIKHMPKRHIWGVEGKVRGTNLGNNKFQFDFNSEQDLQKVLQRRPCHFNKWSFSLERWIPTIQEDFLNSMLFWVAVSGVPIHYKKDETYRNIGNALGLVDLVDVDGGRVRVSVNADEPLKFECRAGYANGDVIRVTLVYEDLHRYCFTCKRISHEEGTCPELTDEQREKNRLVRIEQKERAERETREAFSFPSRFGTERGRGSDRSYLRNDLREEISERRDHRSKNVWNRLDTRNDSYYPRDRERYHPYQKQGSLILKDKEEARERSGTNSGLSNWNHDRSHNRERVSETQSGSRFSSHRRSTPDSQRTISAQIEAPRGRRNDRKSRISPHRSQKEWRPLKESQAGDSRKAYTAADPEATETEEDQRSKLKGKAIATTPSPEKSRAAVSRGKLVIREQGMERVRDQIQQRTDVVADPHSGGHPLQPRDKTPAIETTGNHPEKSVTGADPTKTRTAVEVEPMDDEAFENMLEQYQAPEGEEEVDLDTVDDLMEEELELERQRIEKEENQKKSLMARLGEQDRQQPQSVTQELGVRRMGSSEREDNERRKTFAAPSQGLPSGQQIEKRTRVSQDESGPTSGKQLDGAVKRKKSSRSPEVKGAAASKKLAGLGRSSPKTKTARQLRLSVSKTSTQIPRHEVYPSALKGGKPSVSGSVVSQKPSTRSVLQENVVRTVGTGAETKAWEDVWIPAEIARPAIPRDAFFEQNLHVHHLIDFDTKTWNEQVIRELVAEEDVNRILLIKPSRLGRRDGYVWKHSKSGSYSVKTGYELINAKRKSLIEVGVEEPSVTTLKKEARSWQVAQIIPSVIEEEQVRDQENSGTQLCHQVRSGNRCQVDASWVHDGSGTGLGFVMWEGDNRSIMGLKYCKQTASPLHTETEGLLWAMKTIREKGYHSMHFETDCVQLCKLIQKLEDWPSMVQEMEEIKVVADCFEKFSISYVMRENNSRADCLAKAARARHQYFEYVCVETPVWLAHVASLLE